MSRNRKAKAEQSEIFATVEEDPDLLDLLEIATSPARKVIFIAHLCKSLPGASDQFEGKEPAQLFDIFTTWFGNYDQSHTPFRRISGALYQRQQYFLQNRFSKRQLSTSIGLDWTDDDKSAFLGKIRVIYVSKLKTPYPPKYHWMVESLAIEQRWKGYIETGKQPDPRHKRYPLFFVDPKKLQGDFGEQDTVIVYDKRAQELVMVIIQNLVGHPALLHCMEDIIKDNVKYRKSMRVSILF